MKSSHVITAAIMPALFFVAPAGAEVTETRPLDERIVVDESAALEVIVDNVFGSIRITGHDEPVVEMSAIETVRGDTQSDIERARAEFGLRTVQEPGRIAFLVRGEDDCNCRCRCRWNGYVVEYDIELRMPREAALDVSTVNDGNIAVADVHGRFRVTNVNGDVTLQGLRNAGHAQTVNGELTAVFERSPNVATSFKTVNGEIDVRFPAGLSADLLFRTMHGEIWTDFEVTALPAVPVSDTPQERRTVIRTDRHAAVRVDAGGPAHTFETLNGDIHVRASR